MALKDDMTLLRNVTIFADLSDDHLRLLAFGAERRRLEAGQVLFREGAPADSAFTIVSGRLQLTRKSPTETVDMVAGEAGPGATLTEIAMIADAERNFTATALEPSEVIRISRLLFRRMLEEYPEVAIAAERRVRENFTRMVQSLENAARNYVS